MIGLISNKKLFKNIGFCNFSIGNKTYQLTFKQLEEFKTLKNYSYIELVQYVAENKSLKYDEYNVTKYNIISEPFETPPFLLNKITTLNRSTINANRAFSLRSTHYYNILYTTHVTKIELIKTLNKLKFISIESPKIIDSGLETGGAEMFKINYFDKILYLSQSPQMYKQIMVNVFDKVYEVSTIFRAEKSDSPRHLAEISALDVEMVTRNMYDIMDLLKLLITNVYRKLGKTLSKNAFCCYTYSELASKINKTDNTDFTNKQLNTLCNLLNIEDWFFITNYPEEIRAFYTYGTNSFDLNYKDLEVVSGSLRIHEYMALLKKMECRQMNVSAYTSYLNNFKMGSKPHGGFGLGIDRLVLVLTGLLNILDIPAFPRSYTNIS